MLCVEMPMSIRVPTIARASLSDRSSWPRCTPSASAAAAISGRSFMIASVRFRRDLQPPALPGVFRGNNLSHANPRQSRGLTIDW